MKEIYYNKSQKDLTEEKIHHLLSENLFMPRNRVSLGERVGGSPGLVVMGRDSRPEGRGFESWHRILDGHFSHIFVVKLYCLFEKTENKQKRGRKSRRELLKILVR